MSTADKDHIKEAAEVIAKNLPEELILKICQDRLRTALQSITFGPDDLSKLVNEAILTKAKELLKTEPEYAEKIEKEARLLAARVVGEIPQLQRVERQRGY